MGDYIDAMLAEIDANLVAVASHPFTSEAAADRIYEAYIFALVVESAADAGATVTYYDGHGTETNDLVFRASPGVIHSNNRQWTFAVIRLGQAPSLEVHVRVKIVGRRTRTAGECDVLILDHHTAATSRSKSESPRAASCLAVIECKFYGGPLPVALAREFAQLCDDRGRGVAGYFVSNQRSPMVCQVLAATPAAVYEFGVLPGARQRDHFVSLLREAFKKHVSSYDPAYRL